MHRASLHQSRKLRFSALAITAAMLMALVIVAVADAQPNDQSSTFLVRIIARQLEDGRIEFGLRAGANEHLPADRFVEPDVAHRGWLSSSIVPLGDTKGVRLLARRLAGGWTEFGLRVDGPGTEHLPRARFFPARVEHGRWLVSNRFALELPLGIASHRSSIADLRLHVYMRRTRQRAPESAVIGRPVSICRLSLVALARKSGSLPPTDARGAVAHSDPSFASEDVNTGPLHRVDRQVCRTTTPLALDEPVARSGRHTSRRLLQPGYVLDRDHLSRLPRRGSVQTLSFSARPMPLR